MKTIAVFGGSLNPPGLHHRRIAEALSALYDEVVVIPCGPRPDKPSTNDTRLVDRAVMADLTFRGLPRVTVELFDLEAVTFTKAFQLEVMYRDRGEVWHVVGGDFVRGGQSGDSLIHREWEHGPEMWQRLRYVVVLQPDEQLGPGDLPPRHRVVRVDHRGSSAEVRSRVFHHQPIDDLVTPAVAAYVRRHGLFRGVPPNAQTRFRPHAPRFLLFADPRNPASRRLAERFAPHAADDDAELILVLGGDGTMLHAIRQHWRRRLPFYGVNTGHLGFLLNQEPAGDFWAQELVSYHLPLLFVETESIEGERRSMLAFNDAWVERATGQTAWLRLSVNGEEMLPKIVADGVLVSTTAGSTSYARAMGATPVPFHIPALLLVGSNVLSPDGWKPAVLGMDAEVELTTLDPVKRPLQGYIDGVSQGLLKSLRVRASRIAAAELAFDKGHDPVAKLARIQFPRGG